MKTLNYTVGNCRSSPSIKVPHRPIYNPFPQELPRHSEYGTLSKAVSKHLKKKKKRDSVLLQLQLQDNIRRQIQSQQRCHSVDKLMYLNREKNDQIRRHIVQKASLQSQNQELKMLMIGPSERQLQLQRKINQLEIELVKTRSEYQQRQLKYKQQIEEMKREHRKEINQLTQKYEKGAKVISNKKYQEKKISPQNSRQYVQNVNYVTRAESPPKRQNQFQNIQTIPVTNANQNNNSYTYVSNPSNTQPYQNTLSRSNYNLSPQTKIYQNNSQNQQSYTNVFSQRNIQPVNYQGLSPRRQPAVQSYTYKRQSSPNTTNNTTTQIKNDINRVDIVRTGQTIRQDNYNVKNSTVQPSQYQQYRNVIQKQEKISERPTTFGSEGGYTSQARQSVQNKQSYRGVKVEKEATSQGISISSKDIDDIYKRYYLND